MNVIGSDKWGSLKGGDLRMGTMDEGGMFWPVFLILVGALILMVNVGILPPQLGRFWPVILIILGLIKLSGLGEAGETKKK